MESMVVDKVNTTRHLVRDVSLTPVHHGGVNGAELRSLADRTSPPVSVSASQFTSDQRTATKQMQDSSVDEDVASISHNSHAPECCFEDTSHALSIQEEDTRCSWSDLVDAADGVIHEDTTLSSEASDTVAGDGAVHGAITVPCGGSDTAGHIRTPVSPSRAEDSKTSLPASQPRQCEAGPALKTEGATFGEPSFGTQFNGAELASSVTLTADAKLALLDILKPETNSILRLATDQANSFIWELLRLLENLRSFLGL